MPRRSPSVPRAPALLLRHVRAVVVLFVGAVAAAVGHAPVHHVARVMAGGRRFNFSLVVVIGDKKGRVGVGLGKGIDTALAIDKATRDAKKHMITVLRTPSGSIPHQVSMKYASSTVEIIPSKGRGLVAGSAMRTVLDLAGVTDVVTKIHTRSKNKLTIARATVEALKKLRLAARSAAK